MTALFHRPYHYLAEKVCHLDRNRFFKVQGTAQCFTSKQDTVMQLKLLVKSCFIRTRTKLQPEFHSTRFDPISGARRAESGCKRTEKVKLYSSARKNKFSAKTKLDCRLMNSSQTAGDCFSKKEIKTENLILDFFS